MNKFLAICLFFLMIRMSVSAQSFPPFRITAYDTASTGYYFFCPYLLSSFGTFPQGSQRQMILDHKGQVVYYKDVNGVFAGDLKIHSNGQISYSANQKFYIMDSTFTIIDSVSSQNGIIHDLHDLQILPDGHFLLLGMENLTSDLSGYQMFLGNGTAGSINAIVKAGVVQELDSNKNVVFEWHSADHFDFDDVDEYFLQDTSNVDWTHMNAVELDQDGNILISSRHLNEITKINRSDSSVIWRLGGKRNQFAFIGDSIQFLSQHDIRRIANGHVTLFDNGRGLTPIHPAAAKEYDLDEIGLTATLVWSHVEGDTIYSRSQGNVQRLANGNTLISYGDLMSENIVFNVVDTANRKLFEISFPDTLLSYRAFNYPELPWALKRPDIHCISSGGQFMLEADSGYSTYQWSNGGSTRQILLADTGNYFVFVPYGNDGFISSEIFRVSDITNPCLLSSLNFPESIGSLILYPNPVLNHLTIRLPGNSLTQEKLEVFDITGKQLMELYWSQNITEFTLDISKLSPGTYFIRKGNFCGRFVKM